MDTKTEIVENQTQTKIICTCGLVYVNKISHRRHLNTEKHQRNLAQVNQKVFTVLHTNLERIRVIYYIDGKRYAKGWRTKDKTIDEQTPKAIEFMRVTSKDPDFIFCPHNQNKKFCVHCLRTL